MKKWIKDNLSDLVVLGVYICIVFVLIAFHENWRDEAQSWLIAKNCNFFELLNQMKYEGHFLIWYLIIIPFAKLGFPYVTGNIISAIITIISAWLILRYAPFKKYKKYLFIFSFPMIYLFPVIARCYCLMPLAIALIAIFYKNRKEKPIRYIVSIALLANTHVIMLGMVGILLLDFYITEFIHRKENTKEQNKRILISLALIIVLLILSAIPLMGCLSVNQDVNNFKGRGPFEILNLKLRLLRNQPYNTIAGNYPCVQNAVILNVVLCLAIAFVGIRFFRFKKEFIELVICILWQYIIYVLIYASSLQRAATVALIVFYFAWITNYSRKDWKIRNEKVKKILNIIKDIIFMILISLNIAVGLLYAYTDIKQNYSCSKQIAEFINNNLEDDAILVTGERVEYCSAIVPYANSNFRFYDLRENKFFTYAVWNTSNQLLVTEDFTNKLIEVFGEDAHLYYINTKLLNANAEYYNIIDNMIQSGKLEKVFESDKDFFANEMYTIYKIILTKK